MKQTKISKRMKKTSTILALIVLTSFQLKAQQLHKVPTQKINLYCLIGDTTKIEKQSINKFEISDFITYKEYKEYLLSVKNDSSEKYYLSQLPDTNISVDKDVYQKYITGNEYDSFPVLGISWDNAMNFCKWKTLKDNPKNKIKFIYRLPHCSEWLAAYCYFERNKIKNDFNNKYSDWLLNTKEKYVSSISNKSGLKFEYDGIYLHKPNDHRVLKQKRVIGNSYLYQQIFAYPFSFYADEGYRQISFRYVKESIKDSNISVIKFWGIKK